jgi:hypothetical protein
MNVKGIIWRGTSTSNFEGMVHRYQKIIGDGNAWSHFGGPPWALLEVLGFPLVVLGILFFNVTAIRARVLPSWPSWLMLAALLVKILYLVLPNLPQIGGSFDGVLFYLAFSGSGYSL